MSKLPMYVILTIATGLGGYIPVLLGDSPLGGWSLLGSVLGGIGGIFVYVYLRNSGVIE